MAEIRQELKLEDKFSHVLDNFVKRMEKIEELTNKLYENQENMNKQSDNLDRQFNRLNMTMERFASQGLSKVISSLARIGISYLGVNALRKSFLEAVAEDDLNIRMANRHGGDIGVSDKSRQLAQKYGGRISDYNQTTTQMSVFAGTQTINRLYDIASKLASINPNMSVGQAASALTSGIQSRSGSGIIQSFGLQQSYQNNTLLNRYLEAGNLEKALDMIEKLGREAGATEKSVANMLNSPMIKLDRIKASLDDIRMKLGAGLLQALEPILDMTNQILNSEKFRNFINWVIGMFTLFSDLVVGAFKRITDTTDELSKRFQTISKWVMLLVSAFVIFKGAVIGITAVYTIFKGVIAAVTAVQHGLNLAMAANPIGLVAAAITAVIVGLAALKKAMSSEDMGWIEAIVLTLADVAVSIANIFITMYNAVAPVLNVIIKLLASFVEVFMNLDKPLVAFNNLFTTIFISVLKIISNAIEQFGGLMKIISGGLKFLGIDNSIVNGLNSVGEFAQGIAGKGNEFADEARNRLDEYNKEQGLRTLPTFELPENIELLNTDALVEMIKNMKALLEVTKENSKNTKGIDDKLASVAAAIDPHAWMEQIGETSIADAERRAVVQANTQIESPLTLTVNGVVDDSLVDTIKNIVTDAMDKQNRRTRDNLLLKPKEGQAN